MHLTTVVRIEHHTTFSLFDILAIDAVAGVEMLGFCPFLAINTAPSLLFRQTVSTDPTVVPTSTEKNSLPIREKRPNDHYEADLCKYTLIVIVSLENSLGVCIH